MKIFNLGTLESWGRPKNPLVEICLKMKTIVHKLCEIMKKITISGLQKIAEERRTCLLK